MGGRQKRQLRFRFARRRQSPQGLPSLPPPLAPHAPLPGGYGGKDPNGPIVRMARSLTAPPNEGKWRVGAREPRSAAAPSPARAVKIILFLGRAAWRRPRIPACARDRGTTPARALPPTRPPKNREMERRCPRAPGCRRPRPRRDAAAAPSVTFIPPWMARDPGRTARLLMGWRCSAMSGNEGSSLARGFHAGAAGRRGGSERGIIVSRALAIWALQGCPGATIKRPSGQCRCWGSEGWTRQSPSTTVAAARGGARQKLNRDD